jgi:hypothetical protein
MSGTWYDANGNPRVPPEPNAQTPGDDSWVGTDGEDFNLNDDGDTVPTVFASDGNDTMLGLGGRDLLAGNEGDDSILGGEGDDELAGGRGNDVLEGGLGNDFLDAQPGDDTVYGGDGYDTVFFNGAPEEYTWVKVENGWRVSDINTDSDGDGVDFVSDDVEYAYYGNNGGDAIIQPIPCFLAGTLIATPAGARAIETLCVGDLVLTADGRAVPILFTGRTTVVARTARGARGLPILIRAGALADGVPSRDLQASPQHGIVVDDMLVSAQALVNGLSIRRMPAPAPVFIYYNIETEAHEVILANGTPVETFCDHIGREAFDNHAEFQARYPEGRLIGEMALPQAQSARQLPRATRARLDARALAGTPGVRTAA